MGIKHLLRAVGPVLHLKMLPMRLATRVVAPFGLPPWPIGAYLANAETWNRR